MDKIRNATPEEIAAFAQHADLTPNSEVVTYGGKDFAVIRRCVEIDPMFFHPDSGTSRRLIFGMNLETVLRMSGVSEIYFNVPVADEAYRKVLDTWGAEPVSQEPEIRYKKVL